MNAPDLGMLIVTIKPLLYALGAYILFSVLRHLYKKQKGNQNNSKK